MTDPDHRALNISKEFPEAVSAIVTAWMGTEWLLREISEDGELDGIYPD